MAEIKLQEKKSTVWPWIVGLLVLALVVWGATSLLDDDTDEVEMALPVPATVEPAPAAGEEPIMVVTIVATPAVYAGQEVRGTAKVAEVISDRGFWLEQDGQRIFALVDEPVPETIDINPGQTLQLTGTVYTNVDQLQKPIEDDARAAIQNQPAFLVVKASDIRIATKP